MNPINYSGTKCPNCSKTEFELVEDTPSNSNGAEAIYKYYYLRCLSCKTFLAAFDEQPIGEFLKRIADKLDIKY